MERSVYESMASIEGRHWWFVARRAILADVIGRSTARRPLKILEVGSGTGGNLDMLSGFGDVTGVEPDEQARALSADKSDAIVVDGKLPHGLGLEPETFDLLATFDVLEHLDDDAGGLAAAVQCLKPGGKAVLTVPAFPSLWSCHDEQHHHKRRYTRAGFQDLVLASGLEIERLSYFNTSLFVPTFLVRALKKVTGNEKADIEGIPPAVLNRLLTRVFAFERFFLRRMTLPFGLSLIAIARKPEV
jgi:SAM-dependent methyltransferase